MKNSVPATSLKHLTILRNDRIEVGVLPQVGGRVVLLRRPGGRNVLKSDASLWSKRSRRVISANTRFVAYNGHTVWLGPQSEWWTHQDLRPALKRKRAQWPPDPYLTLAGYRVTERSDTRLVMVSPASPITGIQLTKTVSLKRDGTVGFEVTATNAGRKAVSWDLWLNTRVDGNARCFVPAEPRGILRIAGQEGSCTDMMAHEIADGCFSFIPRPPSAGKRQRWAKAFIHPRKPWMAALAGKDLLVIRFKAYPAEQMHREQALVEIYNATTHDRNTALLELEHHAPFRTLEPGESMSAEETWEIRAWEGRTAAKQ